MTSFVLIILDLNKLKYKQIKIMDAVMPMIDNTMLPEKLGRSVVKAPGDEGKTKGQLVVGLVSWNGRTILTKYRSESPKVLYEGSR